MILPWSLATRRQEKEVYWTCGCALHRKYITRLFLETESRNLPTRKCFENSFNDCGQYTGCLFCFNTFMLDYTVLNGSNATESLSKVATWLHETIRDSSACFNILEKKANVVPKQSQYDDVHCLMNRALVTVRTFSLILTGLRPYSKSGVFLDNISMISLCVC